MSYNSNTGKQSFTAIASQTEFDFNFKIFEETELLVYQTPSGNSPDDANDILTLAVDYTVAITGDTGGKVTLNTGAGAGDTIVVQRNLPATRETEYQTSGDLLATVLNDDQDYQTYLIADNNLVNDNSIKLPNSAVGVNTIIPSVTKDGYIKFNSTGTAVVTDDTVPQGVLDAKDSNLEAGSWANENEDVPVKEYTAGVPSDRAPIVYSAKHWAIKAQDAVIGDVEFRDTEFRIFDDADITKKLKFEISGISSATTGTISMTTDANLDNIGKIKDKAVNDTAQADDTIVVYKTGADEFVYEAKPTFSLLGSLDTGNMIHVQETQASGVASADGMSVVGTQIRTLNTVVTNTIVGASLSANQVTLPAGTYLFIAKAPAYAITTHRLSVEDVTNANFYRGYSQRNTGSNVFDFASVTSALVTIGSNANFRLSHYTQGSGGSLGSATGDTASERYSELIAYKVG